MKLSLDEVLALADAARDKVAREKYDKQRETRSYQQILSMNAGLSRLVGIAPQRPEARTSAIEAANIRADRIEKLVKKDFIAINNERRRMITESKRR